MHSPQRVLVPRGAQLGMTGRCLARTPARSPRAVDSTHLDAFRDVHLRAERAVQPPPGSSARKAGEYGCTICGRTPLLPAATPEWPPQTTSTSPEPNSAISTNTSANVRPMGHNQGKTPEAEDGRRKQRRAQHQVAQVVRRRSPSAPCDLHAPFSSAFSFSVSSAAGAGAAAATLTSLPCRPYRGAKAPRSFDTTGTGRINRKTPLPSSTMATSAMTRVTACGTMVCLPAWCRARQAGTARKCCPTTQRRKIAEPTCST